MSYKSPPPPNILLKLKEIFNKILSMRKEKKVLFFISFLILTSCSLLDGTSLIPDMAIKCKSSVCSESLKDKDVYFGITTDLNFDCDDDLSDFDDYEKFKAFFHVYAKGRTVWKNSAIELKENIESWQGELDSNVFGFVKPAQVCVFIDTNENEQLNSDEPIASDGVDLGFTLQTINKWRNK